MTNIILSTKGIYFLHLSQVVFHHYSIYYESFLTLLLTRHM